MSEHEPTAVIAAKLEATQALLIERELRYREGKEAQQRFDTERDRRYDEVSKEREKALKIKEEADKAALGLAREIQIYKDEKANELREQINSERGLYATKPDLAALGERIDATLRPLLSFMAAQQGEKGGRLSTQNLIIAMIGVAGTLIFIVSVIIAIAFAIKGVK